MPQIHSIDIAHAPLYKPFPAAPQSDLETQSYFAHQQSRSKSGNSAKSSQQNLRAKSAASSSDILTKQAYKVTLAKQKPIRAKKNSVSGQEPPLGIKKVAMRG